MQAALDGFFREQAGAEHQRRIRSVRAAGDRGDDDGAIGEIEFVAVVLHADVFGLRGQRFFERCLRLRERNAVLRALGSGHRGDDRGEIELEAVGENRIGRLIGAEEALFFRVGFDEADLIFAARGEAEIGERFGVDREEAHRRAIFGRHVGDRGAVGKREARKSGAVELDEFSDDAFFAQHLRDGEDEVGGRGAFGQAAVQFEADDSGNQHRERLAEHCGFRFDAADAPAEDAEAVDHGGVRIGADERIGEGEARAFLLLAENDAGEIFEIHLVANAGVRRDDFEILKTFLAPAEEGVALDIALHFEVGVEGEGAGDAEFVHLHGMVDHQFGGQQRIDFFGIAAEVAHRVAHGGEIDHGRDAGEILQQNASGHEGDFFFGGAWPRSWDPSPRAREYLRRKRNGRLRGAVNFRGELSARRAGAKHCRCRRARALAINFEGIVADAECGAGAE